MNKKPNYSTLASPLSTALMMAVKPDIKSERIKELFDSATSTEQARINLIFINLTGQRLDELIDGAEKISTKRGMKL